MREEIAPLTGLRGVAACWVVLYHAFAAELQPQPGPLGNLLVHGYLAVDIFFVLSGFVMAMSSGELFAAGFSLVNYRVFLLRRAARIYPLYLVLTLVAFAELVVASYGHVALWRLLPPLTENLLLIDAWGLSSAIDGPSWSVSAEAAAYLLFPALAAALLYGSRRVSGLGALACLALLAALAQAATPAALRGHRNGPLDIYWPSALTLLRCLAEFALGLVACRAAQNTAVSRACRRPWLAPAMLAATALFLMMHGADVLFVWLIAPLLIILARGDNFLTSALSCAPALTLGRLSYAIYLLHMPTLSLKHLLTRHLVKFAGPAYGEALAFAIFFALLLAAAALCWRHIEQPGRKFIRRRGGI